MNTSRHEALQAIYLDWINNYVSHTRFASDYGLSLKAAFELIDIAAGSHALLVSQQD